MGKKDISVVKLVDETDGVVVVGMDGFKAEIVVYALMSQKGEGDKVGKEISRVVVEEVCSILCLDVSWDHRYVILYGINPEYMGIIVLISLVESKTLSYFKSPQALVYKIKDIAFEYYSSTRFVTCGIQHMAFWTINGNF